MGACCRQGVGGQAVAWEGIAREGWHARSPVIFGQGFCFSMADEGQPS
jgi:hypothetical protein